VQVLVVTLLVEQNRRVLMRAQKRAREIILLVDVFSQKISWILSYYNRYGIDKAALSMEE
jgi:hypothetical protein